MFIGLKIFPALKWGINPYPKFVLIKKSFRQFKKKKEFGLFMHFIERIDFLFFNLHVMVNFILKLFKITKMSLNFINIGQFHSSVKSHRGLTQISYIQ